jgi:hypothetical protein
MKFMLLCYDDEQAWQRAGESKLKEAMQEAIGLAHELHAKGQYVLASPLHPSKTAATVRVRDGQRAITDGPYAETREVLGGFYIIDAKDRDEALAIAGRHPGARYGSVEVRAILEIEGLPQK